MTRVHRVVPTYRTRSAHARSKGGRVRVASAIDANETGAKESTAEQVEQVEQTEMCALTSSEAQHNVAEVEADGTPQGIGNVVGHGPTGKHSYRRRRIRKVLGVLAILALCVLAVAVFFLNQDLIAIKETVDKVIQTPETQRWSYNPPSNSLGGNDSVPSADGTPAVVEHQYPDWSKNDPVNILLIGLDYRPEEEDTRADTQIVIHIDPKNKTASMLSIPRDLWVNIPGFDMNRINSAFQLGDHAERTAPGTVPGGGPGLAMSTIESNFGISIDYFAQVDFGGFQKVVDTLGGVTIDVPRPLVDNDYPLGSYGSTKIYIPAGLQHMDGRTALEYVRSRHADSDLGRNSRQRQVLLALRQQSLNLNLLLHFNDLTAQLQDSVRTDLNLDQLGSLVQLGKDVDPQSITSCQIDATMAPETILDSGADVLMPDWDAIHAAIRQCFADPGVAQEAARISVQNGTFTVGMGRKLSDLLVAGGLNVVDLSNSPDRGEHLTTTIVDYTGGRKPHTIEAIKRILGLDDAQVMQGNPANAPRTTPSTPSKLTTPTTPTTPTTNASDDGSTDVPIDILVTAGDDQLGQK